MKRKVWIGTGIAVVLVAGGAAYFLGGPKEEVKWRTAKVDKGNITARISATGILNALIQVPVGTQVSGVVTGLFADFNSLVKKGQVIGKIDEIPWISQLQDAQATLDRAKAALANAQVDYRRNKQLWDQKLLSDADLDAKDLALKTAQTSLASAKAGLDRAKINLGYCTLRAPVDGVVVNRLVDVGQTVAASFSTPNMFTIAQDLSKMKVQAAIDEADIGQVRVGERAFFTVDSYPEKQFRGIVSEVQLNPVVNQNVVTYNVVMEVNNEARSTDGAPDPGAKAGGWKGRGGAEGPESKEGKAPHGAGRPDNAMGRPGGFHREAGGAPRTGAQGMASAPSTATGLESATARYIPAGSPVYRGDLALFPGMTANCTIVTKEREQVLRVPASALRFNPAAFMKDLEPAKGQQGGAPQGGAPRSGGGQQPQRPGGSGKGMAARREDRVWILVAGKPKALTVKAGASDGMFTEISGEGVTEGMVVLTGVEDLKKVANAGAAPIGAPGGGMRR
jgi:RND family efflux transporter MFP subunit